MPRIKINEVEEPKPREYHLTDSEWKRIEAASQVAVEVLGKLEVRWENSKTHKEYSPDETDIANTYLDMLSELEGGKGGGFISSGQLCVEMTNVEESPVFRYGILIGESEL